MRFLNFYNFFAKYSIITRFYFTLLFIFFISCIWFGFLYLPINKIIANYQSKFKILNETKLDWNLYYELQEKLKQAKKIKDHHYANVNIVIDKIFENIKSCNIELIDCKLLKKIVEKTQTKFPLTFNFSGNFYDFMDFFEKISNLDLPFEFQSLKINKLEDRLIKINFILNIIVGNA